MNSTVKCRQDFNLIFLFSQHLDHENNYYYLNIYKIPNDSENISDSNRNNYELRSKVFLSVIIPQRIHQMEAICMFMAWDMIYPLKAHLVASSNGFGGTSHIVKC